MAAGRFLRYHVFSPSFSALQLIQEERPAAAQRFITAPSSIISFLDDLKSRRSQRDKHVMERDLKCIQSTDSAIFTNPQKEESVEKLL